VWFPNLAPSADIVKVGQQASSTAQWKTFERKYRAEMARPDNRRTIELLAALSKHANFSVGCYCEDETRCHRSILRTLLATAGAEFV